jgi:hypothetical protein
MLRYLIILLLLSISSCAADIEEYPPKWVVASYYLPKEKLVGLQSAGFFEINDSIYSHHCDSHGNMIRLKYNEEGKTWKQIKYESLGCGDDH